MRLKIKFILVICFISFIFFPLIAIAQDIIIFEDDFSDASLSKWILFGSPRPRVLSNVEGRNGVFDNNGDSWCQSGAISKANLYLPESFIIEADMYLKVTNPSGCWAAPSFMLLRENEPLGRDPYCGDMDYPGGIIFKIMYEGDACWQTPVEKRRHAYITAGIYAEDGTSEGSGWILADEYINGWHNFKIVVVDRYVKFYVDDKLIFAPKKKVHPTVLNGKKLYLGRRSSGSAGKGYHDFIRVYADFRPRHWLKDFNLALICKKTEHNCYIDCKILDGLSLICDMLSWSPVVCDWLSNIDQQCQCWEREKYAICPADENSWALRGHTWSSEGDLQPIDYWWYECNEQYLQVGGGDHTHAKGTVCENDQNCTTSYSVVALTQGNIWSNEQCWYCPERFKVKDKYIYIDIELYNNECSAWEDDKNQGWHVMHAINTWLEDNNHKLVLDIIFHHQGDPYKNPHGDTYKNMCDEQGICHYGPEISSKLPFEWTRYFINLSALINQAVNWAKKEGGVTFNENLQLVQAEMLSELRNAFASFRIRRFDILYFNKNFQFQPNSWLNYDSDGDGIENKYDPLPLDYDADDDGLIDGPIGSEDLNANGIVDPGETDPINPDTDGDGIFDGTEKGLTEPEVIEGGLGGTNLSAGHFIVDADPSTTTDPTNPDTDGDGLLDGEEDINKNGAVDIGETSPILADTDGDGYSDGEEVAKGSEPLDPNSVPAITGDLDNDADIDQNDLNILLTYRNQPASECPECDIDGDGVITVLDARKLVLLCTRPRCATE